jgi:surface polysaccharide O-acyltransferase-like enzyme
MISGALFLDTKKEINIRTLFGKNILHIALVYLFWSTLYIIYLEIYKNGERNIAGIIGDILVGPFHLWFLPMLIGLYIITPILRTIVKDLETEKYLILLSVFFAFLIPLAVELTGYANKGIMGWIRHINKSLDVNIVTCYVGYFVLGHYLNTQQFRSFTRKIIYILGGASFLTVILLTYILSNKKGFAYGFYYDNHILFTLLEAMAIFIFFKSNLNDIQTKWLSPILHLSKLSLGVYLIHPFIIFAVFYDMMGLSSSSFNPIFAIPLMTIIVFVISFLISGILKRMPLLNYFL